MKTKLTHINQKYLEYNLLRCIIILFGGCYLCSCASQEIYNSKGLIDHSLCVNSHLGYSGYDFDYRSEICKELGVLNVGMVRDYVFINSADLFSDSLLLSKINPRLNRTYIIDNVLYHLQKNAPKTHVLGVLHDMKWEIDKDIPFNQFYDLIKKAVKRYNGSTLFRPTDSQKEMSYEIKYWELCNEFDANIYGRPPFDTIDKTFELLKQSYLAIKDANPNAIVLFPGIANAKNRFLKDIMDYQDSDGKRIWDYFDIYNFHVYPNKAEDLIYYINIVKEYQKKYGWDKPVWLTEVGWSEQLNSESEVAEQLPKMYMVSFACGVEKVFQFQFRSFDYNLGWSASFGLIRSSVDGSYMSLTSGGEPLSLGTAYQHILLRDSIYTISSNVSGHKEVWNNIYKKLKKAGLTISGNNYIINKISIISGGIEKSIVFNNESGVIHLPYSEFANMSFNDTIAIYLKSYKNCSQWKKTDKKLSYYSVKHLIELMPNGATMPSLKVNDGLYEAKWQVGNNQITALWSEKERTIEIVQNKKVKITDCYGRKMKINSSMLQLNQSVIYFEGNLKYIVK